MKLVYNHQIQPMQHAFTDPSGQVIKAKSLRKLVEAVAEYRLVNGLPPGSPEDEVAASYLPRWPHLVDLPRHPEIILPPKEKDERPAAIWGWLCRIWRDPPKTLLAPTDEEAKARIAACKACALNDPIDLRLDCGAETVRRTYLLAHGETPKGLGYCPHHHWLCGLACLLPEAQKRAKEDAPENCWVEKKA